MRRLILLFCLSLPGCGRPDNVAICLEFMRDTACGDSTAITPSLCGTYREARCNFQPYFDCNRPYFVCQNGMYDAALRERAGAACQQFALCTSGPLW